MLSARGAPLERPPKRVVGRSCCRGAYLRGALLGAGSLSGPRDAHLELRAAGPDGASLLADIAAREGIALATQERRTHAVAYAKSSETIADLLAVAGASETALRLDEHGVSPRREPRRTGSRTPTRRTSSERSTPRESSSRRSSSSTSTRSRRSSERSPRSASRHPSLSLAELAEKCRPQITKAAAHHRMAAEHSRRCRIHSGIDHCEV